MKSQSNERPLTFHPLGDGSWHYNYNVNETTVITPESNEINTFEYDTVHFWGNPDYGKLVASVIRESYSIDDELAILRQRESKPVQFAEYNSFCEGVKAMVKNDLK